MMNTSKLQKILIPAALIVLAALAGGWWMSSHKSSNQKSPEPTQEKLVSACEVFSLEEAKKVFNGDIYQTSLDGTGDYKLSGKIQGAPKTKIKTSTCAYTDSKMAVNNPSSDLPPEARTEQPAPELKPGEKPQPVDLSSFADSTKKQNANTADMPEFLAIITVRSTATANAKSDFKRAKPKSAHKVAGLGDSAFWDPKATGISPKKQGSLSVLSGENTIIVTGDSLDVSTAKKIAETVLSRL